MSGFLLRGHKQLGLLPAFFACAILGTTGNALAEVRLITPSGSRPAVPFLVCVEVRDNTGARDWNLWDAEALLTADQPGISLSPSRVAVRNGLGTALLTIGGNTDFTLTATVNGERATRTVRNLTGQPSVSVQGTLPGASTTWSGIVSVTGNVTVPSGHTLTIQPNTLVLINGVASGTTGFSLTVNGSVQSLGTELGPVVITCSDANLNWGQIRHADSQPSTYQHTFISKAGRAPGEGHTGTGPAFRLNNATLTFDGCVISDLTAGGATIGKIMMADASTLTFRDCVLTRARMGPEIAGTGLVCTNSYLLEMTGPDDADGIYLHTAAGRPLTLSRCVIASGADDAIDTLDSTVTVENCLIRDWPNANEDAKGVSVFNGEVLLRRCLIANCFAGVSAKSSGPLAVVRIDHCTIAGIDHGVAAATKSNASAGNINIYLTNSIVRSVDALRSDFGPEKFVSVTYNALSEVWPGTGNTTADPLFVDAAAGDYRLLPNSPCLNAGAPAAPPDPDGSRTDIGYFAGSAPPRELSVRITSPASGAVFAGPTNITITATADALSGTVTRVEFFQSSTKLGEDLAAPYSFLWSNVREGKYTLRAVATQSASLIATSAPVNVVVTSDEGSSTNILVAAGSDWKYLDTGADLGAAWRQPTFDDSSWNSGKAQLGYGDGDEVTVVGFGPNANNRYITTYFRRAFSATDLSSITRLTVRLLRDDGGVVYLNGTEVFRSNMPAGAITAATRSSANAEPADKTTNFFSQDIDRSLLVAGPNLLAVEIHQANPTSSDLSFDLELNAVRSVPPNARPLIEISSPANNSAFNEPATIALAADASDPDGGVASVSFYANGSKIGEAFSSPFAYSWNNITAGAYTLTAVATDALGLSATSSAVNITVSAKDAPLAITTQSPPPGIVTSLTEITVTFAKDVLGVDAADLLINGAPAKAVAGSGSRYTFTFQQPEPGTVAVRWAAAHGIRDLQGNAFGGGGWNYVLDPAQLGVAINEIMYHPASENPREEFIELFNRGPSAVNLRGWRLSDGVEFTFPNLTLPSGGYLVVAADLATFKTKYPSVTNVVGNWTGLLSNSREDIDLDDAQGRRADSVRYADEGDWAARRRGPLDRGHRGWVWFAEHDGLGKSLELINPNVSNNSGQNWASSRVPEGTPGKANSVLASRTPPLIRNVAHFPIVPKSTEPILVTAEVSGESRPASVALHYRVDRATPPPFAAVLMRDDGQNGDASPRDGIFSVVLPPQTNSAVVEFYVEAGDSPDNVRTWPAPAIAAADGAGPSGQVANALLQVDDAVYSGSQPLYKLIMTEAERAELAVIPSQSNAEGPNSQMNCTFISFDGTETNLRYLTGVRNRGHGSRTANPPNYRVNFRTDDPWKAVTAINLNTRQVHMQNFGSWLAIKSGAAGTYSRAVQVRVNNANRATPGAPMFGSYAANEVYSADWADRHFPSDSGGNLYRIVRDIRPPNFDYRGAVKNSYTNTYFKETNVTEDDWRDLIGMLQIMGENSSALFTTENVRKVVNVDQWLTHLAVMNLMANGESGLNTGNNDDYFLYRGESDPRFILLFHDLDQILGQPGSLAQNVEIFRGTCCPISGDTEGSWRAMTRFLRSSDFGPLYLATLQRLLDTTFSKPQFDTLIDQVLGSYVPQATISSVKTWMDGRRNYVQSQLPARTTRSVPLANVSGAPRSPTPRTSATLDVGGAGITHYRFSLNGGAFGAELLVDTPIALSNLANGTNTVAVIGRNAASVYQDANNATRVSWVVNTAWLGVRLNEIIASRTGALRDQVELLNEGAATVNLAGLRLTDDLRKPNAFTFGPATLARGAFLVLDSAQLGFSLDAAGDGVYLLNSVAAGGALLDFVEFGAQMADLSLGRVGEGGDWQLTQPTFGSANVIQPVGDLRQIRINEWLASGISPYPDDFVELYNPESRPVALGGCSLTDQPIGAPARRRIAPLSFIPAKGFALFVSGNGNRANEFNFGLDPDQGEIALFAPDQSLIDSVVYGPQRTGVSTGRCPDGDAALKALDAPTPGGPNQCPFEASPPQSITLVPYNHVWKFEASGTDLGTAWFNPGFDAAAWNSGPGLLGVKTNPLPEPIRTVLPTARYATYYFRAQFNVDPALAPSSVQVSHLVDDGAAFYLNGREVARYNLAAGATYESFAAANLGDAALRTFTLPADQLRPGANFLAVEVHQINATSSAVVFGLKIDALMTANTAAQSGVLINEVLANNATFAEPDGSRPDWVELYNPSATAVDLAGLSLTDNAANPRRWSFPGGSIIPAKGFLKVRFDAATAAAPANTGFGLNAGGGAVFLFGRPAEGGSLQSSVTYGLQPADWSIGRVPDGTTNWTLTVPTVGAANRAATLGNPRLLKINEWMADAKAGVRWGEAPAEPGDWFEIFNPNPEPVDLSGFWLSDNLADPMKHLLPPLSFIGIGLHGFQKFVADEQPEAGANHVNFKLSGSGESLALSTANGGLIDGLSFGPQLPDVSEGRFPDGAASLVSFAATPTPGSGNYLPLGNVVINELLSHSDPPLMDAVELFNASASAVDLSGWFLSDSASNLRKFQIPAGAVIAPGGFAVFYEDQFNRAGGAGEPFSFSSAKGDEVFLSQAVNGTLTGYRASAAFGPAENGVSFGRFQTRLGSHFVPLAQRTFGKDNPATTNEFKLGAGAANSSAKVGPVVFSEIMYHPAKTNAALEFVELHNFSAVAVPLYDPANPAHTWRLRKGVDFDFPLDASIPAGGFLVVVSFDPRSDTVAVSEFQKAYGTGAALIGPFSGKLNRAGDTLELQKPDAPQTLPGPDFGLIPYVTVERIDYSDASPWPASADSSGHSLHRRSATLYGNDPANWTAAPPNPGAGFAAPGDSDHDGLPNDWEIAHGLNPNDPSDAAADSDADGLSNAQEYLAGTNPRDAASVLKTGVRADASGGLTLEFTAAANRAYAIELRNSLTTGAWQKLADIPPAPSDRVMRIPIRPTASSSFFRAVLIP